MVANRTIMRCWFEFCEVTGRDPTEFGIVPYDEAPRPSLLREEDEALSDFSVYVTENPRKAGKESNTGQTAASYVSHVRTYPGTMSFASTRRAVLEDVGRRVPRTVLDMRSAGASKGLGRGIQAIHRRTRRRRY